ncbi:MAG: hypothetical protein EOR60_17700 [Mesorhizobium sp.]|nr:MAG: hypothetical protein EOR60_17700 [Mesorhizobium sp.]
MAVYILAFPRIVTTAELGSGDVWRSPIYLDIIGGLLLSVANSTGSIFESAAMRFIGRISCSLYLLHAPAIGWLAITPVAFSNLTFIPEVVVTSISLATLSYLLIETMAWQFLNRRVYQPAVVPETQPAP